MDEIQRRHRQEQKDLQARVTQKKKNANKKTRKGVNDECAELERQLHERHRLELNALVGDTEPDVQLEEPSPDQPPNQVATDGQGVDTTISKDSSLDDDQQPTKKRSRQKERLARRAAEQEQAALEAEAEASNQTDFRAREREIIESQLNARGLIEKEVRSDGHCLYAAVADQLKQNDIIIASDLPDYKVVRRDAASFIESHPDDYAPFLEEPLDEYVVKIRDTAEWGGQLELSALSKIYGVNINVLQGDGRVEKIDAGKETDKEAWLAYYRHSFGLGEHYNSLRKKP